MTSKKQIGKILMLLSTPPNYPNRDSELLIEARPAEVHARVRVVCKNAFSRTIPHLAPYLNRGSNACFTRENHLNLVLNRELLAAGRLFSAHLVEHGTLKILTLLEECGWE